MLRELLVSSMSTDPILELLEPRGRAPLKAVFAHRGPDVVVTGHDVSLTELLNRRACLTIFEVSSQALSVMKITVRVGTDDLCELSIRELQTAIRAAGSLACSG